ncbi:iron-uptake factor PiuC [Klebsiella pneumoniae]|uniref:Iron-uptake factor PiuC n=2 Tax=Klebsiella pneumoniae TaxID=573 RepID=A0A447RJK3_KLEPN|nr:iron-uptake factor PiuC [Klebsiella pneumoniae]
MPLRCGRSIRPPAILSVGRRCALCRKPAPGSDGAVGTPDHTEGYWVADAKLGYRVNSNLDLQLNMYNLFDTDYVASINKSGYRYHPGEPRTFMLTAKRPFLSLRVGGRCAPLFRENTAMMYHIPDVLSTDQVAEFTRQLAQAEWVDGRVTVGSQGAAVKQNQQIDTRTPLYARLQAAVLDMLRGHPQFFSAALPRTISAPLFNRYGPGEEPMVFTSMAPFARTARRAGCALICQRRCSFAIRRAMRVANWVIEDTYGQHRVKLPAGHLVLYPASSLHCVTPRSPAASARPLSCGSSRWSATISSVRCFTTWTAPSSL